MLVEKNWIKEFIKCLKSVLSEPELIIKLSEKAKINIGKLKLPKVVLKWKELFEKI